MAIDGNGAWLIWCHREYGYRSYSGIGGTQVLSWRDEQSYALSSKEHPQTRRRPISLSRTSTPAHAWLKLLTLTCGSYRVLSNCGRVPYVDYCRSFPWCILLRAQRRSSAHFIAVTSFYYILGVDYCPSLANKECCSLYLLLQLRCRVFNLEVDFRSWFSSVTCYTQVRESLADPWQ